MEPRNDANTGRQPSPIPYPGHIPGIRIFADALAAGLFAQLLEAFHQIGRDGLKGNYSTTFWHPRDRSPANLAEACVSALFRLADPGPGCVGMEWWLGRLRYGKKLPFHFDRDTVIRRETGSFVNPLYASVLYLNDFPGSPTVITDQVPGPDGQSRVPARPRFRESIAAVANRYVIFPGNLRHGVIPEVELEDDAPRPGELRLSFLVNYWQHRPTPPVCFDYDGSIYPGLSVPPR